MKWKHVRLSVGLLLFLAVVGYGGYLRWTNIDMTDARLTVTFWREYIALLIALFVSLVLIRWR